MKCALYVSTLALIYLAVSKTGMWAIDMLDRASLRAAMNPNYVAEWQGDWKTQMAQAKASENQRQTFLAAADALGKVTVGGGIASMVG
jgi:hypothetical protein